MKDSKKITDNLIFALVCGIACGLMGVLFNFIQKYASMLRSAYPNAVFLILMPCVGLLIVLVTKLLGTEKASSGNVIAGLTAPSEFSFKFWLSGLLTLTLTNVAESSMVREGGAFQTTVPLAMWIRNKIFRNADPTAAAACAVSAGLSSIWGLPVFGAVFAAEMGFGIIDLSVLLPSAVSSAAAYGVSRLLFPNNTAYACVSAGQFEAMTLLKVIIAGVAFGLFARLVIAALDGFGKCTGLIKNAYVRIFIAGALVALVCFISENNDFLCGFNSIMTNAFSGKLEADGRIYYAFAAKLVVWGLLMKGGYKTGSLIQIWSVGALFGGLMGFALGLAPGLGAMLGAVSLFAGTYNVPCAAVVLFIEMFPTGVSAIAVVYALIAVFAARAVSGKCRIYGTQKLGEKSFLK